jgi:hypothetical protein
MNHKSLLTAGCLAMLHARTAETAAALFVAISSALAVLGIATAMPATASGTSDTITSSQERSIMWMTAGTRRFSVMLESNPTAAAFVELLPAAFDMSDLNGNEKHVRLPRALPVDASRPGTIRAGDVMLYGQNTLVVFYKTFNSAYSYTRIGRIEEGASLEEVLGSGPSRITFTAQ